MDEVAVKKVLYLSYDGMTDPLGQSQVLPYLCGLSESGFQFTILSFEKRQRYNKERKTIEKIATGAGIKWVPFFYTKNPPVVSKIYDRWKLKKMATSLHKKYQFDMIHCRSYVAAEMGLELKKRTGVKFLFDMRGFWADEKVDNGQWNLNNWFFKRVYAHYKKKEKEFLLNSDGIISLTNAAKVEMLNNTDYKSLEIDVIPCCADLDHFNYQQVDKSKQQELRTSLGISSNQKMLTYLGSAGGWYMIREMLDFFGSLTKKDPLFKMLILTKDDPELVKQLTRDAGIDADKLIVRYAERKELPVYISLSDCSIFFIRPTYSKIASSPTKHAELMGMGIPVICNNIGDTGLVIKETGTGILVKKFTENEYEKVIAQIDQLLQIPKEKIRQAAFQYFDLSKGTADYLNVYKRIFKA